VRFLPVAPDDRSTPRFDKLDEPDDLRKVLRYSTKMPFEGYEKKTKAKGIEQISQEKEPNSSEEDDEEEEPDSIEQNDQAKEPKFGKQSDRELEPTSIEQSHLQLEAIHHYRLFSLCASTACLMLGWQAARAPSSSVKRGKELEKWREELRSRVSPANPSSFEVLQI
jgi:hypothetical protein